MAQRRPRQGLRRHPIVLVAHREFTERLRDRSFLLSTGVILVILVAALLLPRLFGFGAPEEFTLGLVGGDAGALGRAVRSAAGDDAAIELRPLADRAAAEQALADEEVAAVLLGRDEVLVQTELDADLARLVQTASARQRSAERLAAAGVPEAELSAVLSPAPLPVTALDPPPDEGEADRADGLSFALTFLLYGQMIGYGMWVAMGVVEEKSTRVVEVLLATIRPRQLLAGKVLGIGLLGLGQLLLIAVVTLTAVVGGGLADLPEGAAGAIASAFGWFLLGFAFYACLFAVAGALVSRQEELQSAVTPLTLLLVLSFFAAFPTLQDPTGTIARVATYFPPSAPMVLPVRVAQGAISGGEIAASVGVMLAVIGLLVPLAGRVYRGAILHTGSRVGLREVLRAT